MIEQKFAISEEQIIELEGRFNWRIPLRTLFIDHRVELVSTKINLKDKTILDVGTLDGHIATSLLAHGAKVTSLDCRLSNLALGFARAIAFGYGANSIDFQLGDVEALPKGVKFNIIFHSGTFYHLHDPVNHLYDIRKYFTEYLILETHTARLEGQTPGEIEAFGEKFTGTIYPESGMSDPASSKNVDDSFWLDHESLRRLFIVCNLEIYSEIYIDKLCPDGPRSCWILKKEKS